VGDSDGIHDTQTFQVWTQTATVVDGLAAAANNACNNDSALRDAHMALRKFGFIVTGSELDPAQHRQVMQSPNFTMISVGVADPSQGLAVARQLAAEGVQLVELCGGFGPRWTAQIIEALGPSIPVGSVAYGPESIDAMHALFKA
jgi:hypothetical protein